MLSDHKPDPYRKLRRKPTPAGVRLLQELRRQLHDPSRLEEVVDEPVTPAA
jgi:hypothetical protein